MMKPHFSAQEIDLEAEKNLDMISAFRKLHTEKVQYKKIQISELENVFKSVGPVSKDVSNLQTNLIIMTGDPGVGKTTAAQRFAWMWAKDIGELSKIYKLAYFIPVKNVEVRATSLTEILSHLQLLPDQVSGGFQSLSCNAKDILFILDGADENDITQVLLELISGECYPESTVLMTARPESKCFEYITKLPRVKVTLLGVDDETAERYMKQAVSPSSEDQWKLFEAHYKEKIHDRSLLNIPLYLTLLCAVFKAHIAEGLKRKVPKSSTQLFSSFLQVILKRWLAKSSRPTDFRFTMSPLGPDSSVPAHIKRFLRQIGQLCYKNLLKSKYEFTNKQASKYLLDMQEIKDSGLFTVGNSGSQEVCFLKHKQLQEYLAALYLSLEGVKESNFTKLLSSNKGVCLALVMHDCKLIQVVQFACGLSAKFYTSLLDVAASEFSVMKSDEYQIDIHYEAALFTERHPGDLSSENMESLEGFAVLKRYLFNAEQKRVENKVFNFLIRGTKLKQSLGFYEKCLQKLAKLFDMSLSVDLLSRLYKIVLTPVTSDQSIVSHVNTYVVTFDDTRSDPESSDSMTPGPVSLSPVCKLCLQLDQLQTELLSAVCVHGVQSVDVPDGDVYVDIPALLATFPHLTELDVECSKYKPYQSSARSERKITTALTRVKLFQLSGRTSLPQTHVESLLKQSGLTHLVLYNVSILSALSDTQFHPSLWSYLQCLTLSEDVSDLPMCAGTALKKLLQASCNTLTECVLYVHRVHQHSLDEIKEGMKTLHKLEGLTLDITLSNRSEVTVEVLVSVLPHLNSLHTLYVDYYRVQHDLTDLVEVVCSQRLLRQFHIVGGRNKVSRELKHKLHSEGIGVTYK